MQTNRSACLGLTESARLPYNPTVEIKYNTLKNGGGYKMITLIIPLAVPAPRES